MEVTVVRDMDFAPEWGGNRDLPASEQIRVTIKTPTVEERQRAVGTDLSMDPDTKKPKVDLRMDNHILVQRHCTLVEGLKLKDTAGKLIEVHNGADLLAAPGLHDLVNEIGAEIARIQAQPDHLDPTLELPSGSGSKGTSRTERKVN